MIKRIKMIRKNLINPINLNNLSTKCDVVINHDYSNIFVVYGLFVYICESNQCQLNNNYQLITNHL